MSQALPLQCNTKLACRPVRRVVLIKRLQTKKSPSFVEPDDSLKCPKRPAFHYPVIIFMYPSSSARRSLRVVQPAARGINIQQNADYPRPKQPDCQLSGSTGDCFVFQVHLTSVAHRTPHVPWTAYKELCWTCFSSTGMNFNTTNHRFVLFHLCYKLLKFLIFYFSSCVFYTQLSDFFISGQLELPISPDNRSCTVPSNR